MDSGLKIESGWAEHAGFANWLVNKKKPELVVDLGTYQGLSALAFKHKNDKKVITIDKKIGKKYLKYLENNGIECRESLFDDEVDSFENNSIDMLHIDGDHKIDAVANDIIKWAPKVSIGGIILMHDVWNPAFKGPLQVFAKSIDGFKLMFLKGNGLGIITHDENIMRAIYQEWGKDLIGLNIIQFLVSYIERKDLWIKVLSESSVRDQVLEGLREKTDLLLMDRVWQEGLLES